MKEDNKINCKNCIYYIPHYVKYQTTFHQINCGQCANANVEYKTRMKVPHDNGCNMWMRGDKPLPEGTLHSIYQQLYVLTNRIEEMKSILGEVLDNE